MLYRDFRLSFVPFVGLVIRDGAFCADIVKVCWESGLSRFNAYTAEEKMGGHPLKRWALDGWELPERYS
jgi:hypothetical protein